MEQERVLTGERLEETAPVSPAKKNKRHFRKEWLWCYLAVGLPFFGFIFFNAVPVVVSFASMFCDANTYDFGSLKWNAFANFVEFFHDGKFLHSLGITVWLMCAQIVSLVIALVVASLLNARRVCGEKVFKVIYFIPYICSSVAIAVMWSIIFEQRGVLNQLLGTDFAWLNDALRPQLLTWAIFVVIVWPSPGYGIIMYTAALKGVDTVLYEAAELDGANAFHKFWNITLPMIAPMTYFLLLAGVMGGLGTFDQATILAPVSWTGTAGPEDAGLTVQYYIYYEMTEFGNLGYASVMQWAMTIITLIPCTIIMKLRKRSEENIG